MEDTQPKREQDRTVNRIGVLIVILYVIGYGTAAVSIFNLFVARDVIGAGAFAIASTLSFGFLLNAYTR
jgi:hypothetical protein